MSKSLEYLDYGASLTRPNIVVDGSPNEATVLALTHWPGIAQPDRTSADTSAEMAFRYLDNSPPHPVAEVVTNNHFDQDGLVAIHTLIEPELSLAHRELLIDAAGAGDFGTYSDRRAARASMALSRYAERETTCEYDEFTDQLYCETLPQLLPMLLDGERFRELWEDEDAELTASEDLLANGTVSIHEHTKIDLAVVTIPASQKRHGGHRFGGMRFDGLHPMAINNATDRFRLLVVHGQRYQYTDRYETWVQYRTRRPLARIDLRPMAEELNELESSSALWSALGPDALTPQLSHTEESSLGATEVERVISKFLDSAPSAWNPYDWH